MAFLAEQQSKEGTVGAWQVVVPPPPPPPEEVTKSFQEEDVDVKPSGMTPDPVQTEPPDEDDSRSFKVKKKKISYNLGGISFTPSQLAEEIKKHLPDFKMSYSDNDSRQAIADSWPKSIDDTHAQEDWDWKIKYDLPAMVEDMLTNLKK